MKRTKEELMQSLKTVLGDNVSDEALALIEDVNDTFDGSTGGSSDEDKKTIEDLQKKLKEQDEMWRKKYTDRFFNPVPDNSNNNDDIGASEDDEEDEEEPTKFDDLFAPTDK